MSLTPDALIAFMVLYNSATSAHNYTLLRWFRTGFTLPRLISDWLIEHASQGTEQNFTGCFKNINSYGRTYSRLTLTLLTWRIWWAHNNASKWQMGFNSAFEGFNLQHKMQVWDVWHFQFVLHLCPHKSGAIATVPRDLWRSFWLYWVGSPIKISFKHPVL